MDVKKVGANWCFCMTRSKIWIWIKKIGCDAMKADNNAAGA